MTLSAAQSVQLHCHHCTTWLGESESPLTFVGMFKDPQDRNYLPAPRNTYRCKRCGWVTVFWGGGGGGVRRRAVEVGAGPNRPSAIEVDNSRVS